MKKILEYLKKNWRTIILILAIGLLVFFNVDTYKQSLAIYRENQRMNIEYSLLQKEDSIKNQQIINYKSSIAKKDSEITKSKQKINKTDSLLKISQNTVKTLSKRVLEAETSNPEELENYVLTCDSLAVVAPILSDQVDSLKKENLTLVSTLEEKSILQDSIINKKDELIFSKNEFINKILPEYNKATEKLQVAENKLSKEKKKRNIWTKIAIGLGVGLIGVSAIK